MKDVFEIGECSFPDEQNNFLMTQQDVSYGEEIDPISRMSIFSPDEFELFIQLWAKEYLMINYKKVVKCSGAGDKGRDVIAYYSDDTWDNYQCKHYDRPLSPTNIWIELGKLCYYTYHKIYSLPKKYYFVCHRGVGPSLNELIEKPEELKKLLFQNWDSHCMNKITKTEIVAMTEEFKAYILDIDFSIFDYVPQLDLVSPIKESLAYASLFGGGLKKRRDVPQFPPADIDTSELVYTRKIFDAYSDHLGRRISSEKDLLNHKKLSSHFDRQRKYFYSAESLLRLERDIRTPDTTTVSSVKEEIFDSVIDLVEDEYSDGLKRMKVVTAAARKCDLSAHPLLNMTMENDKHGICHHLANENRIEWVDNE